MLEMKLKKYLECKFHMLLMAFFLMLLLLYLYMSFTSFENISMDRHVWLYISILASIAYLYVYRRKTLFCYETLFFAIFILGTFFNEIILENIFDDSMVSSVLFTTFSRSVENKGVLIQMLALFGFMAFASFCNRNHIKAVSNRRIELESSFFENVKLGHSVNAMALLVFLFIIYLYISGTFASWFHYSDSSSNKAYSNLEIVYGTILFIVFTTLEFSRLYKMGCHSITAFLLKSNKFYLTEILFIAGVLLISGNRNESLLIIMPAIAAFSIMIKPISNKLFLTGVLIGGVLMVMIGLTRTSDNVEDQGGVNAFTIARDFGVIDTNTRYLIQYTDKNTPIYFKNAFVGLLSTVPFVGGIFVDGLSIEQDIRSTVITTHGMQLADRMDSGLGTSLIGDLYYTASGIWVILFMSLYGYIVAYMHNLFVIERRFSPWWFILFAFNLSNVAYYIRAEWTMPLRYIGFSFILLLLLTLFYKKRKIA